MSQVTYKSEKVAKKKVIFTNDTGADLVLRGGYALCYDDTETDITQAYDVIRPATTNLRTFAGVLCEEYDGRAVANGATLQVEIYIPTKYGQIVPCWSNEDHSVDVAKLAISDGSFVLTEGGTRNVAYSVQLANRSVVNGTLLSRLYGASDPFA